MGAKSKAQFIYYCVDLYIHNNIKKRKKETGTADLKMWENSNIDAYIDKYI